MLNCYLNLYGYWKKLAQNFTKSVCCSIHCVQCVQNNFNQMKTFLGL